LDKAPEAVMVLDPNLVVRYASRAIGDILGLDPRSVAGNPFSAHLHPEDEAWARNACAASGLGAGGSSRELRVRHADSSWHWFEAIMADLTGDPDVRGVAVYLRDVTGERALIPFRSIDVTTPPPPLPTKSNR